MSARHSMASYLSCRHMCMGGDCDRFRWQTVVLQCPSASPARAQVAVLGALPADTPRGAQLQAALATLLLQRLVPPMPKVPPTHPSWRLLRHKYNLPEYDESAAVHLPVQLATCSLAVLHGFSICPT